MLEEFLDETNISKALFKFGHKNIEKLSIKVKLPLKIFQGVHQSSLIRKHFTKNDSKTQNKACLEFSLEIE